MSTVYRIQDREGRGPWCPGFSHRWVEDRDDHNNLLPWYEEFGPVHLKAIVGTSVGSACRSVEQLRRWFTANEYATLKRLGYQAVRMKAGRILAESEIQCVFERVAPLAQDVEPIDLYPAV